MCLSSWILGKAYVFYSKGAFRFKSLCCSKSILSSFTILVLDSTCACECGIRLRTNRASGYRGSEHRSFAWSWWKTCTPFVSIPPIIWSTTTWHVIKFVFIRAICSTPSTSFFPIHPCSAFVFIHCTQWLTLWQPTPRHQDYPSSHLQQDFLFATPGRPMYVTPYSNPAFCEHMHPLATFLGRYWDWLGSNCPSCNVRERVCNKEMLMQPFNHLITFISSCLPLARVIATYKSRLELFIHISTSLIWRLIIITYHSSISSARGCGMIPLSQPITKTHGHSRPIKASAICHSAIVG